MIDMTPDLREIYDEFGAVITAASGTSFLAQLRVNETDFFDSARGADYTLRYAAGPTLERGDTLTVAGSPLVAEDVALTVSEKPRPTAAGHECIAPLVRAG